MREGYYLFISLVLLTTFICKTNGTDLDEEEEIDVPSMLAEDTAEDMDTIDDQRMKKRRSDMESSEEHQDDSLNSLADEADVKLDEPVYELIKRKRRSLKRAQRLLDSLNESRGKRCDSKNSKNPPGGVKKRQSAKENVRQNSESEDSEEDEGEKSKRKIKRRAKEEMKRINEKKGKKRSSKKAKKHVGARCTEPNPCDACQTTEEFTLPSTTESECCETKPKCPPPTTRCTPSTTACNMCDTCKDKEEPNKEK